MITNCPWCGESLTKSEVKTSREGNKYVTWYCDNNKECKKGFESDEEI